MFTKILIANRGEIACRVIQTANRLGIRTVAVYSDADANALHVQMADEAVHIGGSAPADSYLVIANVIAAAQKTGAEAIHPGYGFLSENADFCTACTENNLVFIGPPTAAIEAMGSKSAAKQIMEKAGVPLLPGYHGDSQDTDVLKDAANRIGYPVLLKAVSGGGGKGMRQVHHENEFDEALAAARREAKSSFGDADMLVEKYLQQPRHVEVQVFCDSKGNGVYLFERDCSVQRRHQKIIEEAPAPGMTETLRDEMGQAALRAAAAVDYVGAGTVEFLLDASGQFFFMEMNTRLQVEHPVTEMITGQDLVEWQLLVASGDPLPCQQSDLKITGHAFEARIYAEDPDNDFLPAAGTLQHLSQPTASTSVRIDTGVVVGDDIGVFYDPMIAKLIVWGPDRRTALNKLDNALANYRITGITTNIDFLRRLAQHPALVAAEVSTDFIDVHRESLFTHESVALTQLLPLASLYAVLRQRQQEVPAADSNSPWHANDHWRTNAPAVQTLNLGFDNELHTVEIETVGPQSHLVKTADQTHQITGELRGNELLAVIDGHRTTSVIVAKETDFTVFTPDEKLEFSLPSADLGDAGTGGHNDGFKAPMNGTIVDVFVLPGEKVSVGDTLVIMEAMKMEHAIKAPADGTVTEVFYGKGELVDGGEELLTFIEA